jgi:hypothetical protein
MFKCKIRFPEVNEFKFNDKKKENKERHLPIHVSKYQQSGSISLALQPTLPASSTNYLSNYSLIISNLPNSWAHLPPLPLSFLPCQTASEKKEGKRGKLSFPIQMSRICNYFSFPCCAYVNGRFRVGISNGRLHRFPFARQIKYSFFFFS